MRKKMILALATCLLLTGCSLPGGKKDKGTTEQTEMPQVTSNYETTDYEFTYKSTDRVYYSYYDKVPLMSKGKVMAFIKLNQITKLGIQDWTNKEAVKNSINHSYAVNFTITPTEQLEQCGDCIVNVEPYLLNSKGKIVGKPAYVGWSGFPESAEFLNGVKQVTVEKAFQPMHKNEKKTRIVLRFSSSNDIEFDDVYFTEKTLKKAKKGSNILSASNPLSIKSVSGAKYTIKFHKLEYDNLLSSDNTDVNAICFKQSIKYNSKPTKKAKVLRFDLKKGYMYSKQAMRIQTNGTVEALDHKLDDAQRHLYVSSSEYEYFTTEMDEVINFGKTEKSLQAWELPNVAKNPKYVRFYLEFPEESQALHTTEEILKLKTRYLVVQGKVKRHKVPTYTEYLIKEGAL